MKVSEKENYVYVNSMKEACQEISEGEQLIYNIGNKEYVFLCITIRDKDTDNGK